MSFQRMTIERVDARVAEEVGDRVAHDPVALVLELLELDELRLDALQALAARQRGRELLDRADEDAALLDAPAASATRRRRARAGRDASSMWSTTSSIAVASCVDVLAVERRHVLRVQELDRGRA